MDKFNAAPLQIGGAQMVIVASTLAYTSKTSPLRLVTLTLIGGLGYWHYWSCPGLSTSGLWNGTCAATNIIYCLHHIDLVILKKADRADLAHGNANANTFLTALRLCFSTRSIRSKFQIGNVPSFPAYFGSNKNRANPGRIPFLFRTAVIFAWQYLVLDLIDTTMASQPPEETLAAYGNNQEYLNPFTATRDQNLTRLMTSVAGSFFIGRIIMDFIYRAMTLVAVGTGVSQPRDWPPFFGRTKDSYTIRYFWGRFWHQWLRGPLSSVSLFVSRSVLGLPRRSLVEWYSNVFMTFTLSAAVHVANDVIAGKGVEMGTVWQFQGFAAAMLIEDGVQALWRGVFGTAKKDGDSKEKPEMAVWKLVVGYLWVQVVLFVVVPWYLYPSGRMPAGTMWTVPYSVVEVMGVRNAGGLIAGLAAFILGVLGPEI